MRVAIREEHVEIMAKGKGSAGEGITSGDR